MNPFNSRWSLRCAQGVTLAAALVTAPLVAHAQASAEEQAVASVVEKLRVAMVDPDQATLIGIRRQALSTIPHSPMAMDKAIRAPAAVARAWRRVIPLLVVDFRVMSSSWNGVKERGLARARAARRRAMDCPAKLRPANAWPCRVRSAPGRWRERCQGRQPEPQRKLHRQHRAR